MPIEEQEYIEEHFEGMLRGNDPKRQKKYIGRTRLSRHHMR